MMLRRRRAQKAAAAIAVAVDSIGRLGGGASAIAAVAHELAQIREGVVRRARRCAAALILAAAQGPGQLQRGSRTLRATVIHLIARGVLHGFVTQGGLHLRELLIDAAVVRHFSTHVRRTVSRTSSVYSTIAPSFGRRLRVTACTNRSIVPTIFCRWY